MKKRVIIISFLISFVFFSCYFLFSSSVRNFLSMEPADQRYEAKERSLTYENKDFNYEIEFPKDLINYETEETRDFWTGPILAKSIVKFGLPTKDINWPRFKETGEVFRIMVFKTQDWEKNLNTPFQKPTLLFATKDFTYTYYLMSDFPDDIDVEPARLESIVKTIKNIDEREIVELKPVIDNTRPRGDD